jgi:energy-coupling factor transporter transmembrane protein EcfT
MILILLLFLVLILIQFGSFEFVQIIIWLIVLIISNFLSGINPYSKELLIIRIISVFIIVFILWNHSWEIPVQTSILLPFSIYKITFPKDIIDQYIVDNKSEKEETLYFWDNKEIKDFLNSLSQEANYIVYMQFIPSELDMDAPHIVLSKPFFINRHSSETTIRKFINERLHLMIEKYYLDNIVIQPDVVGLWLNYIIAKFICYNRYC